MKQGHRIPVNLSLIHIFVRYADDFKIMCKDCDTAQKIFMATKKWLNERLHLEISPEKSKITNIRKKMCIRDSYMETIEQQAKLTEKHEMIIKQQTTPTKDLVES